MAIIAAMDNLNDKDTDIFIDIPRVRFIVIETGASRRHALPMRFGCRLR
jgi:hypothetical protein